MGKIKKVSLIIFYILIWLLFILNLSILYSALFAIVSGNMHSWIIFILITILPLLLGYLLRNHFRVLGRLVANFFKSIPKATMWCLSHIKNFRLTLPITILLSCIVLGGFFYATQVIKQRSIEKQQRLDLQAKSLQEELKREQDQKEYIATRKKDCFDIYNKEKDNWNNTKGTEYDEKNDKCYVIYKALQGEWAKTKCNEISPSALNIEFTSPLWESVYNDYHDCTNQQFRKEF